MDQGQDMQFYFVQDDYRLSPKLTANVGRALRVRHAAASRRTTSSRISIRRPAPMIFAKDGSIYERALIHPDRNNVAPRIGFAYTPGDAHGRARRLRRSSTRTPSGRDAKDCSGSTLRTWSTTSCRRASPARRRWRPRRRSSSSTAIRRGSWIRTRCRRPWGAAARMPNQRTPYIQQFNVGVQYELRPDVVLDVAYVGNKGTKLNGFRNLNQRAVITNPDGSQSAGARPYPAFGDIQWMENRVSSTYKSLQMRLEKRFSKGLSGMVSYTWGEALTGAPDHISTSGGGAGLRHRRVPRAAGRQQPARRVRSRGVRRDPPRSSRAMSGNCPSATAAVSGATGAGPMDFRPRRLAAHRHPRGRRAVSR